MSLTPGSFRPEEISEADTTVRDGDLAAAYAAARALEQAMPIDHAHPSPDFADRVMSAVAVEPAPRAAGFVASLLARPGLTSFVASVREAWSTASGAAGRPFGVRAAALAYVFVVLIAAVSVSGAAVVGTAGAFGLFSNDGSPVSSEFVGPQSPEPSDVVQPSASPEPSESAEPSESPGASESAEPDESPTAKPASGSGSGPAASPESSGDLGSTPSPSSSDDHGDGGSSESPRPSDAPKPSETPH